VSNSLAIATVTATLARHLSDFIANSAVHGARVTFLSPGDPALDSGDPILNVYMFRVTRNAALDNSDLPMRGPNQQPLSQPRTAINLDYLITCFGDEAFLEPQRLLGEVVAGLHADPVLTPRMIQETVAQTQWLAGSDLATQSERVKLTPTMMTPDEMAWFWGEFIRSRYQLSVFYVASVVMIDVAAEVPAPLPVRQVGIIGPQPGGPIVIDRISNADSPEQPLVGGCRMAITGLGLGGEGFAVLINGEPARALVNSNASTLQRRITLMLTPENLPDLHVGMLTVEVIRRRTGPAGVPGSLQQASLKRTTVLLPSITKGPDFEPAGRTINLTVSPPVRAGQSAVLLLNGLVRRAGGSDGTVTQRIPVPVSLEPRSNLSVTMPAKPALPPGTYLCWIEIAGLQSLLVTDRASGRYIAPVVVLTDTPA
jgi:hypothetical protein